MKKRFFIMPLFGILVIVAISTAVMLLWNFVVPGVFGLATIGFWQAMALFVLTRILFGSFPGKRGMPFAFGRRGNPFREKWEKMSPEERKRFIDRRKKFGFGAPFGREEFLDRDNLRNQTETPKDNE